MTIKTNSFFTIQKIIVDSYSSYQKSMFFLLLVASLYGFILGIENSAMGASVQFAQFLLGKVVYPLDSKEYYLFASTFSLLNYLSALFLFITDSEVLTSIFISAIIGSLAFQVLVLAIFIIYRNSFFALISAIFIASINLIGEGIAYPIYFMGTNHDFGRAGLFFPLYAILLISLSKKRLGYFLLGLSLGVHIPMGFWAALCFICAMIINRLSVKDWYIRGDVIFSFLFGISVFIGIYFFQKWYFPVLLFENLNTYEVSEIFNNYIKLWDHHRQKFYPNANGGILYAILTLATTYFLLIKKYDFMSNDTTTYLRFIFITTIFSIPLVFIPSWFMPEYFPSFFIAVMPGRFINYSIFLSIPLSIAFLGTQIKKKNYLYSLYITIGVVIFFIYTKGLVSHQVKSCLFILIFFLIFIALKKFITNIVVSWIKALFILVIYTMLVTAPLYIFYIIPKVSITNFFTLNIPLVSDRLVLVTMEKFLLQAENRRPILSPHLDGFAYLPNGSGLVKLNQSSEEIFGISLKNKYPLEHHLHGSSFALSDYKNLWMNRACQEWKTLSEKYGFDLIIVPETIELKTDLIFSDKSFRGYSTDCIRN